MSVRIRQSLEHCDSVAPVDVATQLADALDYYDGIGERDKTILEDALIARYAVELADVHYKEGDIEASKREYVVAGKRANIRRGRQELIQVRHYRRLVNSIANLFTEPGQAFRLVDEDGERVEDAEETLNDYREMGGLSQRLVRADRVALALGSCVLYAYWSDGQIRYRALAPYTVTPLYGAFVEVDGKRRLADRANIDDATAWIIRIAEKTQSHDAQFLAYVGACRDYEYGRCCLYYAQKPEDIPLVGADTVLDEYLSPGGDVANPYTLSAREHDDVGIEYPFAIVLGSDSGNDEELLPTDGLALYRDALEIDLAYSRLANTALKSARGITTVTNEMNDPPPSNADEGIVLLGRGQTVEVKGVPASNSSEALKVVQALQRASAESWGVPGYEVASEGAAVPESGVALYLRSLPKIRLREQRVKLNAPAVDRLYQIERIIIERNAPERAIGDGVYQVWDPGDWTPPVSDTERLAEIDGARKAGMISYLEAFREYHRLPTAADAAALIEQMRESDAEVQPLAAPQAQEPARRGVAAIAARRQVTTDAES